MKINGIYATERKWKDQSHPAIFNFSILTKYTMLTLLWICFIPAVFCEIILWIINKPLPIIKKPLIQLFETCQQIDLRLQQFIFWPGEYMEWVLSSNKLDPKSQAQYIGFWNTLWLIANDVILGAAVGGLMVEYQNDISTFFTTSFQYFDLEIIDKCLIRLLNWPAGLKLNAELSQFFGDLYHWMLYAWRGFDSLI
jgi:phosphatidylinositol glycan class Q protein